MKSDILNKVSKKKRLNKERSFLNYLDKNIFFSYFKC